MGRKRSQPFDFRPLKCVEYHKELHHTCKNSKICKKNIQPSEKCKKCEYYELREVEVAHNPIRHNIDWWN